MGHIPVMAIQRVLAGDLSVCKVRIVWVSTWGVDGAKTLDQDVTVVPIVLKRLKDQSPRWLDLYDSNSN